MRLSRNGETLLVGAYTVPMATRRHTVSRRLHSARLHARLERALRTHVAACGQDTLPVRWRPRIRVLVTGDELTHAGAPVCSAAGRAPLTASRSGPTYGALRPP